MKEYNGIEVFVQSDEENVAKLSDMFVLYDNLSYIFEDNEVGELCDDKFEQDLKQKFSAAKKKEKLEHLKNKKFILDRNNLIFKNFGLIDHVSKSGLDISPPTEKISIKLDSHDTNLEFKYEISPLETLLELLSQCERKKIFSKFHPSSRVFECSFKDIITGAAIKKEFINEQKTGEHGKSNPYTQIKPYEAIINSVVGDDWEEKSPLKYYQLVELLSDIGTKYGYKLKSIFNRLDNEPSFDLIPDKYHSPFKIPTSIHDIQNLLDKDLKCNYEVSNQNPNCIPSILKELFSYLLDNCDSSDSKAFIKILPELFEKIMLLQSLAPEDKYKYYLNEFSKIGMLLDDEKDLFAQFAFKLQLKLIAQKYRSISEVWKVIKIRSIKKLSNKQFQKYLEKYNKQILTLKQNQKKGIDLSRSEELYQESNTMAFQVIGILDLINSYPNTGIPKCIDPTPKHDKQVSDISIILRMIANEKNADKEKKDILVKFNPPVPKGTKKSPVKKLNAIARSARLAASSNKPVSNYLYRTHMHYWGLLFIHTKLTQDSATGINEYETDYNEVIGNVWKALSGEIKRTERSIFI